MDGRRPRGMMFAPSGADPAPPVGGANMSEPQDAASESIRQTRMPGHGWPAPEGNDVRSQRSQHERAAGRGERINTSGLPVAIHEGHAEAEPLVGIEDQLLDGG